MTDIDTAVRAVSEKRLWQRMMTMAEHGATAKGGVNRQAASAEDAASQRTLMGWAAARGFTCCRDEIGNLFVRREGTDKAAPPVVIGSHLDSQPTGGKFDGAYGVMAAFEVLEAISDAGLETRSPIEVVSWMNEEGSRYSPGAMGSGVFARHYQLDAMLDVKDRAGKRLGDELAQVEKLTPAPLRPMADLRPAAYLEAHIEQGPLLEAGEIPIGVVGGIQGIRRFTVEFTGEEAHAGTTPRSLRKDALVAATQAITALNREADEVGDELRFTVGTFSVSPSSPNTVPGGTRFSIDLRHPSDDTLSAFEKTIQAAVEKVARDTGCPGRVERISRVLPTVFDAHLLTVLSESADKLGYRSLALMSGAGHDAMHLAKVCPSAMIFIPCHKGISHNEAESATSSDLVAGARVLAMAAARLAMARN